jgi:beta-galactosidase
VGGLLPNLVSLPQGPVTVTFHRLSGARTALSFFQWTPILRDIVAKNWRVVGPYRFGQDLSSDHVYDALEPAMKQAFPPEAKRDFSAPVTLQNGQTATWTALTGDSPYVDLYAYSNVLQGSVNSAVTYLHSPVAHRVRLTYGVDYWAKIWMNGQLVQDFGPHGGAPFKGQFSVDVDLQPGWNELLMKVASGSGGNGLWMAISDPGDLTYANQPAPPAS